jgi:quercetin dioxygenase-like cupin family protein
MSAKPVIVTAQNRPRALNVVGEQVTVLADGATTGNFEIFHQDGPEGSGPPPHNHPWHEAFFVLAGQIIFGIEDSGDQVATPGTFVFIPGGSTHWFRFGPGGGQMLSMTPTPAAADMFADADRQISPDEPNLDLVLEIGAKHGLTWMLPAD